MAGLKPSFSVDFSVNEGCFVSNMVVVLVGSKVAIVKQPKIVKQLINTGKIKMQRSFGYRCIVSKLNAVAKSDTAVDTIVSTAVSLLRSNKVLERKA